MVELQQPIQAALVATVRLTEAGDFSAKVSAAAEYAKGRSASAEIEIPEEIAEQIRKLLVDAMGASAEKLGPRLALARFQALEAARRLGEV